MAGGAGLGELVTTQGLAGRPGGSQRVGPGAVATGGPLGPVQLQHLLAMGVQEASEAGAITASAFDRPHPLTVVLVGQSQQLLVAGRDGRHGRLGDDSAADCLNDRGGVGVVVGVDPDGRARRPLPA
jgi:hypothetical protein